MSSIVRTAVEWVKSVLCLRYEPPCRAGEPQTQVHEPSVDNTAELSTARRSAALSMPASGNPETTVETLRKSRSVTGGGDQAYVRQCTTPARAEQSFLASKRETERAGATFKNAARPLPIRPARALRADQHLKSQATGLAVPQHNAFLPPTRGTGIREWREGADQGE